MDIKTATGQDLNLTLTGKTEGRITHIHIDSEQGSFLCPADQRQEQNLYDVGDGRGLLCSHHKRVSPGS